MKAACINRPDQIEIIETPCPEPGDHELLIQVMASGICGTDIHIFRGEYLGGYPVIPGHEFSGIVVSTGPGVSRFSPGDRVAIEPNISCDNCVNCLNNRQNFCLNWQAVGVTRPGGMAQYTVVPEKAAFKTGDLPFDQAAFVEPLSCVLHGIQRLGIETAANIAILGAGPIGLLLLQAARLQGAAQICMVDKNEFRASFADLMGADQVYSSLESLQPDAYDAVIDATGAIPVMARTIDFVRPGGKILLFGVPPAEKTMQIEAFKIFRKGLTLLSSFTSVRNSFQAVDLLRTGRINVGPLISHHLPLHQFQHGIELLEGGLEQVKKVIIEPSR